MIVNDNLNKFYNEYSIDCIKNIDFNKVDKAIKLIIKTRQKKGRIFFIGVGGSAANCSHANNDFRKLANLNSFCLTDNTAELTARTNDDGWENVFSEMLKTYSLNSNDLIYIMSVGGGDIKKKVSVNIIKAIKYAKIKKCKIVSVVAKENGYAALNSDISIVLNVSNKSLITPISESVQSLIWHSIVSDPRIQKNKTVW